MKEPAIADAVTVTEYYLALTLIYAGCPLVSITRKERNTAFVIVIPEEDYKIYRAEYVEGKLQVADMLGQVASRIGTLIKGLKVGQTYYDPQYVHHFMDDGEGTDFRD